MRVELKVAQLLDEILWVVIVPVILNENQYTNDLVYYNQRYNVKLERIYADRKSGCTNWWICLLDLTRGAVYSVVCLQTNARGHFPRETSLTGNLIITQESARFMLSYAVTAALLWRSGIQPHGFLKQTKCSPQTLVNKCFLVENHTKPLDTKGSFFLNQTDANTFILYKHSQKESMFMKSMSLPVAYR